MTFDGNPLSPAEKRRRAAEAEQRERERRHGIFARVCEHMLEGKALHEIAGKDGLPRLLTLLDWIEDDDDLRSRFNDMMWFQFQVMADKLVSTVDAHAGKGPAALKVRIAARKWRDDALAKRFDLQERVRSKEV